MHSTCQQQLSAKPLTTKGLTCFNNSFSSRTFRPPAQLYLTRRTQFTPVAGVFSRYGAGASSPSSYSPPAQSNPSSAVHSVSFNQQLLIVLCIPAAALGIPFALSHPIFCIILPLIVFYNPSLQEVVKPLLAALLQLILSGLRPAGSSKSAAFPWQQASQSTWTSPPIDIEYKSLPGDSDFASNSPREAARSNTDQYNAPAQPSTSYQNVSTSRGTRPRAAIHRQNSAETQKDIDYRRKVSIRPANGASARQETIVRQAAPGQVGVNLRPDSFASASNANNSTLVRVLLGVFPFLRHWGGFV